MTTKWPHFVVIPGSISTEKNYERPPLNSIEESLKETNKALLRVLETQEIKETDVSIIEQQPWKIWLEDLLDTAQWESNTTGAIDIKKLRSDVKSRIISGLKRLWLDMSHLEWDKRKNASEINDSRVIRIDEEFIKVLRDKITNN